MTYAAIRFEVGDGVATVTLARPDKLNAIDRAMREDLRRALREVARDDTVRALILTGTGRAFSAGQDVGEPVMDAGDGGRGIGRLLSEDYNRIILALATLEKPVVAAVNGVAAGMGVSLVLASDIAIAARSARFIQAFIGLGLGPDGGASFFLPRAAGRARAAAQLMLGDPVSAEDAAAWGMIWRAVDDGALASESRTLALRLARGPTKAYGLIKRALNASGSGGLERQLALEAQLQEIAAGTADGREGIAAFREKRKAAFKGR